MHKLKLGVENMRKKYLTFSFLVLLFLFLTSSLSNCSNNSSKLRSDDSYSREKAHSSPSYEAEKPLPSRTEPKRNVPSSNKDLILSDSKSESELSHVEREDNEISFPLIFSIDEITEFEQVKGQSQWISSVKSRIEGATWRFNANGTFAYSPPDSRDDLFPLSGNYTLNGKSLNFDAYKTVTYGSTGSATAQVMGSVNLGSAQPILQMDIISTMGNSAKVNNIKFASDSASAYRVKAILIKR